MSEQKTVRHSAVADPDLQIRRGGVGGHPDPEIRGWGPSPGSATVL